jgi:hypothetical protein
VRINVYSQELTNEYELVEKESNTGVMYCGVRMFLASPDLLHFSEADDDRSAVTFWIPNATSFSKDDLATLFRNMANAVDTVTRGHLLNSLLSETALDPNPETECEHAGIECERNEDEDGTPECPCRCDDCRIEEVSFS